MENSDIDFSRYYDLESHLFATVGPKFQELRRLDAFDFFCIVIWKANRSKSKVAKRLLSHSGAGLQAAVEELTSGIAQAADGRTRLRYLMKDWGFRLPMASAILTVFYPDEFTVYDVRVCDALDDFRALGWTNDFESLWAGYVRFVAAVRAAAPEAFSLRDKDRWLWGRDFRRQLDGDMTTQFGLH